MQTNDMKQSSEKVHDNKFQVSNEFELQIFHFSLYSVYSLLHLFYSRIFMSWQKNYFDSGSQVFYVVAVIFSLYLYLCNVHGDMFGRRCAG